MSNATTLDQPTSSTIQGPPERPVELVIVYGGGRLFPSREISFPLTVQEAVELLDFRRDTPCARAIWRGIDLNGNPFSIDVGATAQAVYVRDLIPASA